MSFGSLCLTLFLSLLVCFFIELNRFVSIDVDYVCACVCVCRRLCAICAVFVKLPASLLDSWLAAWPGPIDLWLALIKRHFVPGKSMGNNSIGLPFWSTV